MKKAKSLRMNMLAAAFIFMGLVLMSRLYHLQIIQGSEYADNFVMQITREIPLKSVRGNIYDRKGRTLARNELIYNITFSDSQSYASNRERQLTLNGTIYKIIKIAEKYGSSVSMHLDMEVSTDGSYQYSSDGFWLDRFRADVFGKAEIEDMSNEERSISADDMIRYLSGEEKFCVYAESGEPYTEAEKKKYGLPDEWNREDILKLLGVRHELSSQAYQRYLPVTVAEDISREAMTVILENKGELPGVDIEEDTIRIYEGGEACTSVIGYTGKISDEELEEKGDKNYNINSVVGKSGIEQYLEEELQGEDGTKKILVDNMGRTVSELSVMEATAGQDVYLSMDIDLQNAAYDALEKEIAGVLLEHIINEKTFDKTYIEDTTDICIPVYDVYCAFFMNGLIDLEHMKKPDAADCEKELYRKFLVREKEVLEIISANLSGETDDSFSNIEEKKEYENFIIEKMEILLEEYHTETEAAFEKWRKGQCSLKECITEMIVQGWLKPELIGMEQDYPGQSEMLEKTVLYLTEYLKEQTEFEKLIYKYMLMNDIISPDELIMILYGQNVLSKQDGDYEVWIGGELSACELTLRKIQKLEITPADLALDPCSGSAVVTEVQTGKVLACVSYPGYDNNRFANDMDTEYYMKVQQNGSLPLFNRATQQLSAPGSTFKPVTIIAGIQEGVIDFSTSVYCDGVFDKVAPPVKCWNHDGHGEVATAAGALQHSCNDYLCEVSYRLGLIGNNEFSDEQALSCLRTYAELFDLDKKSGIELAESESHVTDNYAIPSAIGQGTNNFSTVQLARYANTLAGRGKSYKLSLITGMDGIPREPELESIIELPEETWDSVQTGMEWYAQNTGIFEGFEIPVAGKSGTAQEIETRPDHGLFIGYAPADNPEISIAVRIANGYEAAPAVSCARDIFEAYFRG